MKRYQVLWIDDDAEKQDAFLDSAYLEGMNIKYFKTSKSGMEELSDNLSYYDAIILDARVFNESEDEAPSLLGLHNSIKKINNLSDRKKIPYFIFSGYIDKDENASAREMLADEKIFTKGKDNQRLFDAIKNEADKQIETQIKHENQALFDALAEYPDTARDTFISIFKGLKGLNNQFEDQLYFTQLRIILESFFRKANGIGLLHDKCVTVGASKVNLTDSSLFLSGQDTKYLKVTCSVTHFPKLISDSVRNIIFTTGAASHTTEVDVTQNIDIQTYRKDIRTPYLLYSLALQLMDVLIWFDGYRKTNSDVTYNKSLWQDLETANTTTDVESIVFSDEEVWLEGHVINIHKEKGFAFLSPTSEFMNVFIPPYLVSSHTLKEGIFVKGLIEEYNDTKTGDLLVKIKQIVILKQ
jgi:hypothetical protein